MDVVQLAPTAIHREVSRSPAGGGGGASNPLRVLTLTTLFPSSANPRHGIFIETRLRKLITCAPVSVKVVAPVPWFPSRWSGFGRYATYCATPRVETRNGLVVDHPRYLMIPKIGMAMQPRSLAAAAMRAIEAMPQAGADFDVIDAHYFYPDGVAAALVSAWLKKPLVITARGSDVNLIAQLARPREAILDAAAAAQSVIAVSAALKQALAEIGVATEKIEVLRNGVDIETFRFSARDETRRQLGVGEAPLIVSVGNLVVEKGHDLVLQAAARVAGAHVVIVGRGAELKSLKALALRLGIGARTRFLDNMPQSELARIYSAADVLVLGSQREGWPNVLLEALACGTPVVAADVGGVREIVATPAAGLVVGTRLPEDFAAAIDHVLATGSDRAQTRAYAARFDWESIARRYFQVLEAAARLQRAQANGA